MYQSTVLGEVVAEAVDLPVDGARVECARGEPANRGVGDEPIVENGRVGLLAVGLPWLAHAASLFWVENTTSGQPLPEVSKSWILVRKVPEPLAPPS